MLAYQIGFKTDKCFLSVSPQRKLHLLLQIITF